jgi:hypothetical protein
MPAVAKRIRKRSTLSMTILAGSPHHARTVEKSVQFLRWNTVVPRNPQSYPQALRSPHWRRSFSFRTNLDRLGVALGRPLRFLSGAIQKI